MAWGRKGYWGKEGFEGKGSTSRLWGLGASRIAIKFGGLTRWERDVVEERSVHWSKGGQQNNKDTKNPTGGGWS